jgi:hypothetical protein
MLLFRESRVINPGSGCSERRGAGPIAPAGPKCPPSGRLGSRCPLGVMGIGQSLESERVRWRQREGQMADRTRAKEAMSKERDMDKTEMKSSSGETSSIRKSSGLRPISCACPPPCLPGSLCIHSALAGCAQASLKLYPAGTPYSHASCRKQVETVCLDH